MAGCTALQTCMHDQGSVYARLAPMCGYKRNINTLLPILEVCPKSNVGKVLPVGGVSFSVDEASHHCNTKLPN